MKTTRLFLSVAILAACSTQGTLAVTLQNGVDAAQVPVGTLAAATYFTTALENSDKLSEKVLSSKESDLRTINKTTLKLIFASVGMYLSTYLNQYLATSNDQWNGKAAQGQQGDKDYSPAVVKLDPKMLALRYGAKLALAPLAKLFKASKKSVKPGQRCTDSVLKLTAKTAIAATLSSLYFGESLGNIEKFANQFVAIDDKKSLLQPGNHETCKGLVAAAGNYLVYYLKQRCGKPNEIETDGYLAPERPAKNQKVAQPA